MSVYTPLSLEEVQAFAEPYGLAVIDLIPIQGGIQNTNYFLVNEDGSQFVLTVFEEMNAAQAGELVPVLEHLGNAHLPVAVPLKQAKAAIGQIAGKPAQIAPRLVGEHPIPANTAQTAEVARAQAKLHVALQDFDFERQSYRNHSYWSQVAAELRPDMDVQDQLLLDSVFQQFEVFQAKYPQRPLGFIHSDLFRDNTLFEGDTLKGILDFYELNHDELLFDIAITINDFCSDYPAVKLDQTRVRAYLENYQTVRMLTEDEKACLPVYLAMAACRFWLMRLQVAQKNAQEQRGGEDILQKDPLEMRNMLQNRLALIGK